MTEPHTAIVGEWLHAYEEDTGDAEVYRPARHPFRPSRRPRRGLEFRADGTFVELRPGPADRPLPVTGRWHARESGVRVVFPEGGRTDLTVLSCEDGVLKIAK